MSIKEIEFVMKNFLLPTFLFLTLSCTKQVELGFKGSNFFFKPAGMAITNVKTERWMVGPKRKQTVSKGITVQVTFPQFDRADLEKIANEQGIDSWLVKVRKRAFAVNTVLGYVYIPLVVPGTQGDNKFRRHQIKKGGFSIYYSAAAISKRFERLACPAFSHDRYINDVTIDDRGISLDQVFGGSLEEAYVPAKVLEFSYSGNIFNGGASLVGDYSVEIALYNHKDKRRKSNFVELSELVRVTDERRDNVDGCEGVGIPEKEEDVDKMRLFRWKNDN